VKERGDYSCVIFIYIYIFVYFHYFLPLLLINGPLKINYKELYINLLKGYRHVYVCK
jgi:hypothetical protein